MLSQLSFKISFMVLFLIGFQINTVNAASTNSKLAKTHRRPQAVDAARNAKGESKQANSVNRAKAQTTTNNKAIAKSTGDEDSAGSAVSVQEEKKVVSEQNENEKTKRRYNKKNTIDEDKSEEPIDFNDQRGILAGLDYPELQVVPRASERLALEAQEERSRIISPYWPVQMSAITLIVAGVMSRGHYKNDSPDATKNETQKNENAFASQLSILTGGLWLGTTYYMSHYMSYGEALQDIRKISGKDKKNTLLRERLAEEAIERPARITYLINTLSVWSTLFSALYTVEHTTQLSPSYAGIAAAMAFVPWLIDNRITRNWEKHQEYKRKIYAPLTMGTWQYDLPTREWRPLLTMNWVF